MPYLNEQYFILFDPLWIYSTSVIHLILQPEVEVYIYLFKLPLCIYIIVWFDYIVANIVTVIPHRAHR
ncbi:hypothetical protein Hanom_Chr14g01295261 [Helianthus anomalus]